MVVVDWHIWGVWGRGGEEQGRGIDVARHCKMTQVGRKTRVSDKRLCDWHWYLEMWVSVLGAVTLFLAPNSSTRPLCF